MLTEATEHGKTFDWARGRLVAIDDQGATFEWENSAWFQRPARVGRCYVRSMTYDSVRHRALASIISYEGAARAMLLAYDGIRWTPLSLPSNSYTAGLLAFDDRRDRLMAFAISYAASAAWEFDGSTWSQPSPTPFITAVVFHPLQQRVIGIGPGPAGVGAPATVWSYDGSAWTVITQAGPPFETNCQLAYDPIRLRLLFRSTAVSGTCSEWEWDGIQWLQVASSTAADQFSTLLSTSLGLLEVGGRSGEQVSLRIGTSWTPLHTQPRNRGSHTSVGDCARSTLLSVGSDGTWSWDGQRWVMAALNPPARTERLLFDVNHGTVIATGPSGVSVWDGSAWTDGPLAVGPALWAQHAYDITRNRVVVFGGTRFMWRGTDFIAYQVAETWEWTGRGWSTCAVSGPSPRWNPGLLYDPIARRCVLAGGEGTAPLSDTWTWDGTVWQRASPVAAPFAGAVHLAFDPAAQRPVAVALSVNPGVYEYDGIDWIPRHTESAPPSDATGALFDPATGRLMIDSSTGLWRLSEVPSRVADEGNGCGSSLRLSVRAMPRVGAQDFGIDLRGAPGPALLAIAAAPARLSLGAGCTVLLAEARELHVLLANAAGFASLRMPLPRVPALAGLRVYAQAAQLDATSPLGFGLSARLAFVVGE